MKTKYHRYQKKQDSPSEKTSQDGGGAAPRVSGEGSSPLPCLYSNISIEKVTEQEKKEAILGLASLLSPYSKKVAHTLYVNVERLIAEAPSLGHLGFVTLTFKENLTDNAEASRRYDILNTNFILKDPRFGIKIAVKEPQTRGAWHYHILVHLSEDIRTGFDFEAYQQWVDRPRGLRRRCPTGSPYLRQLWKDIMEACESYGFGRPEMLPVKSNAEAMGRYLGKYISKGIGQRTEDQKNVRLVNYSKGWTRNSPKFAWNTKNSAEWRSKLSLFAKIHGCQDLYQLTDKLGANWAYRYLEDIINVYDSVIQYLEKYKWNQDGSRIVRETGEALTAEELAYSDRIFKRIEKNDQKKTQLLHAEVLDLVPPKLTYKEWQKTQRKKEEAKNQVFMAKQNWKPPEEEKESYDKKEIEERRIQAQRRKEEREKDRAAELIDLKERMENYPENLIGIQPPAPF